MAHVTVKISDSDDGSVVITLTSDPPLPLSDAAREDHPATLAQTAAAVAFNAVTDWLGGEPELQSVKGVSSRDR